jgi:hypothetical protein
VGCYLFDADKGRYVAAVIDVLTLDGERIAGVDGFHPYYDGRFIGPEAFPRFGLPAEMT